MRWIFIVPICLAGCEVLPGGPDGGQREASAPDIVVVETDSADVAVIEASADQIQEPTAAFPASGPLGRTVASLGDATQPGLWLRTPLVSAEGPGRVSYPETGRSVSVTLIPIEGPTSAGSRLSLQAMQALGASLTDLPEIEVSAGA